MLLVVKESAEAERIKKLLEKNGIQAWTRVAAECGSAGLCGQLVEVHVPDEHAAQARALLR